VQAMFLLIKETLEEHSDKIKNIMEENRREREENRREMRTSMDKL
jgi:Spy/CpxP family protein refolding chaperone